MNLVIQIILLVISISGIFIGFFIGKKNANKNNVKTIDTSSSKININNKIILKIILGLVIGVIIVIVVIFAMGGFKEKIDVTGTSMLEYLTILEDYGRDIDFDGITSGANCYTGKQTKTVNSKKYGKVTVEFSYCKSSNSVYIHVYN